MEIYLDFYFAKIVIYSIKFQYIDWPFYIPGLTIHLKKSLGMLTLTTEFSDH